MSSKLAKDQGNVPYQELLDKNRSLEAEVQDLKIRLEEAEELRRAISEGDLDALIISGPKEELVFTLDSADRAYRVLVETMNEGTATLASDGTILYCNRQFAELTKMSSGAVVGTSVYGFIAPEEAITFKALLKQKTSSRELKFRARDGTSVPVYLSISSLQSEGSPNAWCLVVTDLTEQKKNEEIVSAGRLAQSIIEQAAETIVVCDTEGKITHFSNAVPKICQCDPSFQKFEDVMDLRFSKDEDAEKSILPVSSALRGEMIIGTEAILEVKDCQGFHKKLYLLLNSGPLKNPDGKIIGCVVTLTDITERKRAEETLQQALETLRFREDQFRVLVHNLKSGIALIDETGKFAVVNPSFMQMFGLDNELEILNVNNQDWSQWKVYGEDGKLLHVDDHPVRKAVQTGKPVKDQLVAVRNPGAKELTWMNISAEPITEEDGIIYRVICTYHDITERKRIEKELHESEKRFKLLSEANSILLLSKEPENVIQIIAGKLMHHLNFDVFFNYVFDETCGKLHLNAYGGISKEAAKEIEWLDKGAAICGCVALNGYRIVSRDVQHNGDKRADLVRSLGIQAYSCQPLLIGEKTIGTLSFGTKSRKDFKEDELALMSTVADQVSVAIERKRAEDKLKEALDNLENIVKDRTTELEKAYNSLKESERGLAEAQEMAHLGNWDRSLTTDEVHWSDEVYRIFGFKPKEFGATYNRYLSCVHPDDQDRVIKAPRQALEGKLSSIDYRIVLNNGEERVVHEEVEVVFDKRNNPIQLRGTVQDITERKMAEEALEKMDKIRIKEIHHRIKNNLQVICSLLSLEAERFNDEKMLEALKESQNRVASMALIHEELYKGNRNDKLDFGAYLHKFIKELFSSYNLRGSNIVLKMNLEQVYLDMDAAVPLGIIVNELISNSLKHAFPAGSEGEVCISLHRTETLVPEYDTNPDKACIEKENFQYVLGVADNGKGIPEEIEFENPDSLGLQLVNILVEQIDGCIALKRSCGTEFTIYFGNKDR